jgi:hypothetical protein
MIRFIITTMCIVCVPVLLSQPTQQPTQKQQMEKEIRENFIQYQNNLRVHHEQCRREEQRLNQWYQQENERIRARYRSPR